MTEHAISSAGVQPGKPAYRQALGWAAWLGLAYTGVILVARGLVTYRLGGVFLTPYFAVLLGSALLTAGALWPVLAHLAKHPTRAFFIQFGIQWGTIGLLALGLGTALGAVWSDTNLEMLSDFVARDVVASHAAQLHAQGGHP